jgi:hypothetical protein
MKRLFIWPARVVVLLLCGLISAFLLMSGYESVYNRSLPLVHTLDPVNLSAFSTGYNLDAQSFQNPKLYGDFGKPQTLKLPDRSIRLNIVPPLQGGTAWLARESSFHLLLPTKPRAGNIGINFLYCRSSFRTINDRNLPASGSNIFVDTDHDWRYVYKVTSAKLFSDSIPYVIADTGAGSKLIIDCNDMKQHNNVVIEATLLSVQGIDR